MASPFGNSYPSILLQAKESIASADERSTRRNVVQNTLAVTGVQSRTSFWNKHKTGLVSPRKWEPKPILDGVKRTCMFTKHGQLLHLFTTSRKKKLDFQVPNQHYVPC